MQAPRWFALVLALALPSAVSAHEDLSAAENAVEQIAKAYDVPIELEFRG